MKAIVTHFNPDLDAVASIWLIKRWLLGWEEAEVEFVPAGKTYQLPDTSYQRLEILHVDTGLGKLDHHQTNEYTCAAKLTFEYIKASSRMKSSSKFSTSCKSPLSRLAGFDDSKKLPAPKSRSSDSRTKIWEGSKRTLGLPSEALPRAEEMEWNEEALRRLVEVVNQIDHFQEIYYPDAEADIYQFMVEAVLDGWKLIYREQDRLVVEKGLELIDGVYVALLSKVEAEEAIENKGIEFNTKWGRGIAVETKNSGVIDIAQKRGYKIAVRRHPVLGHIRIKSAPHNYLAGKGDGVDLTPIHDKIKKIDKEGDWYLHKSKTMLINGSAKNPTMRPTKLTLKEIVDIIKSI